jgi:hypothetical protein
VVDSSDESETRDLPVQTFVVPTVMTTAEHKIQLAHDVVDVAATLAMNSASHRGASR